MPEVHLPHVDGRSLVKITLEVVLIGLGVFLGLAGEQCRENAHHRDLAHESLQRFRTEIRTNRTAVAAVKDYHAETLKNIKTYLAANGDARKNDVQLSGIQPVFFESTAWDLALATQSLVYIEPSVAFDLSRIYRLQREYSGLTAGIMQALYLQPPGDNPQQFFKALNNYYGDITLWEPQLLTAYDDILPRIDRALGE